MSYFLMRKGGIPVLAYPKSDPALQWSCSLLIKYCETRMLATISLRTSIPIHGYDDEQTFTLQYDGDNLVPDTLSLGPATICLSRTQLDAIARDGKPKPRCLFLNTRNPCRIWCPPSTGSIAPKHGFNAPFHQLVKLARATDVHIVFDYSWLHRDKQAQLQRIISEPGKLAGFPIDDHHAKTYRQADWSVFTPFEDVSEAPPSYAEASNKRPRQAAINSTFESPPAKRVLLSPAPLLPPSPTEKATTASTPSPKHSFAVPKTSDLQEAVNLAVGTLLPEVLRKILPDMLPHLVAMSSPSLSPSQSNRILTQNRLPSLGALINARATAHVESQLQKIYDDTLEHATGLRNAADLEFQDVLDEYKLTAEVEFQEVVDEQKLDLTMAKDEVTTELARTIDDKLYEFKESAAEIVENLGEQAEMVYLEVREKLDGLVGKERACLKLERETTERDRRAFERERGRATERNATRNRGRRTVSLP